MQYRKIFNGFALKAITKQTDTPADNLAVERGERLDLIPLLLYQSAFAPQQKPIVFTGNAVPYEKMPFANKQLTADDFPQSFYLGEVIEGV